MKHSMKNPKNKSHRKYKNYLFFMLKNNNQKILRKKENRK